MPIPSPGVPAQARSRLRAIYASKRSDYAEAGIPEYWIVNPADETITVLKLDGDAYAEHGTFHRGESAASVLLDGFAVRVDAVFNVS